MVHVYDVLLYAPPSSSDDDTLEVYGIITWLREPRHSACLKFRMWYIIFAMLRVTKR